MDSGGPPGRGKAFRKQGPGQRPESPPRHPASRGRLKNKDIGADKPGRSFDSHGQGRHSLSSAQEPTAHVTEQFAKQLCTMLDDGRRQQLYGKLVLIAEPRFPDSLRVALSAPTAALVTATVGKDLGDVGPHNMPKHLTGTIRL